MKTNEIALPPKWTATCHHASTVSCIIKHGNAGVDPRQLSWVIVVWMNIIVEFFGIRRASRRAASELELPSGARSRKSSRAHRGRLSRIERLALPMDGSPHYLLSLDGREFLTDVNQHLSAGDRVLLLSADAGG